MQNQKVNLYIVISFIWYVQCYLYTIYIIFMPKALKIKFAISQFFLYYNKFLFNYYCYTLEHS